jgi:P4 family phage/plasmid primase-like protien
MEHETEAGVRTLADFCAEDLWLAGVDPGAIADPAMREWVVGTSRGFAARAEPRAAREQNAGEEPPTVDAPTATASGNGAGPTKDDQGQEPGNNGNGSPSAIEAKFAKQLALVRRLPLKRAEPRPVPEAAAGAAPDGRPRRRCPVCRRPALLIELDGAVVFAAHGDGSGDQCRRTGSAFPLTETGDAEHFAYLNRDRVRYDHLRGRWLLFDGVRWAPQSSGEVDRLARDSVRARQMAAMKVRDDEPRKAMLNWAVKGEDRKRRTNLLALAQTEEMVTDPGDAWDLDPWLLGVPNGVVDLRTGELRPGRPEDRITMQAGAPFDPDARCPLWDRTLRDVFDGDEEMVAYVDRFLGYSLTGDCREEVLALCWGDGANGKGTLMNTVGRLLGDYADDLPFSALELSNRNSIPNDIAKLVGKRFVTSSETSESRRLNAARVKALTGRDPMTARFLHREFFTFEPVAKFWLATNEKPVVRDTSTGFWRRINLIPFLRSFADAPDLRLKDKLREEGPGILARLVRGCLAWQKEGLRPPAAVVAATTEYRGESHPLARFLDECCVLAPEVRAGSGELFAAYRRWCGDAREEHQLGRNTFGAALRERFAEEPGARDAKGRAMVRFVGVGLAEERGRDRF